MATFPESGVSFPQIRWQAPSWGAIIAGVCVAIAGMLLLGELCSGIGWGLVHAQLQSGSPTAAMAAMAGAAICTCIVVSVVALFAGGWTAGLLAKRTSAIGSLVHGVIVWALGTLLVEAIGLTSLGLALGGSLSLLSAALRSGMDGGMVQGTAKQLGSDDDAPPLAPAAGASRAMAVLRWRTDLASVAVATAPAPAADSRNPIASAQSGRDPDHRDAADRSTNGSEGAMMGASEDDPHLREPEVELALQQARLAATQATRVASGAGYVAFIATVLGLLSAGAGGSLGGMSARRRLVRAEREQARLIAHAAVQPRLGTEHP